MQAARGELLLIALLFFTCTAHAEIHKWIDADGTIHYTDTPPDTQEKSLEITGSISSYDSPEILPADSTGNVVTAKPESGANRHARKRVVMYSAEWCGVCKKAKQYFTEKNISYTEYDIDTNAKARKDFEKMGGRGVPVILVGGRRMNGFSPGGFDQLYNGQ